ncbi:MAG: FAD-dependent oxidoreductase, partial [Pseudomonadota bacterium]
PSKTLISAAKAAHLMRHGSDFGLQSVEPVVDFAAVMDRVQAAIDTIKPKDSVERYSSLGVNCIIGTAKLLDAHRVEVNGEVISGKSIVIATGGSPFMPPIPGLAEAGALNSDTVWALREQPQRLLVIGGGPIGCELAQSFQRLGTQVTLVNRSDRLIPKEDADAGDHVKRIFEAEGMVVRNGTDAVAVESGQLVIEPRGGGEREYLPFDKILVAVGRRPHTESLNLEAAGVALAKDGTIEVDEYLRTSTPNIFACGDVAGPYQFTHIASHQAGYASLNAMFGKIWKSKVNYSVVPWCTYTEPEVARVGLSEAEAAAQGIAVDVTHYNLDDLDRAIAEGDAEGWVKVLTKPGSDKILGTTIVGPHAGELITEFVSAMTHGLGLKKIMGVIHIYPTYSEANKLAAGVWRKARAPQGALKVLETVQGWLR